MKLKQVFVTLLMLIPSTLVIGQGKWIGENENTFKYSFDPVKKDKLTGTTMLLQSVSAVNEPAGYLPTPSAGMVKVMVDANTDAAFSLTGKPGAVKLKMVASSSLPNENAAASVSKFSMYNLPTSAVTSIFFTIDINAFANNGQVMIPFGYSSADAEDNSTTFNDSQQMSEWWDAKDLFGAIKLDVYEGVWLAFSYRQPRMSAKDADAPKFVEVKTSTPFGKGRSHKVELYCNNTNVNREYVRDGKNYTVFPQTYQWWVNGEHIKQDRATYDFPSTRETAVQNPINSFSINTSGNTLPKPNSLEITIGGIAAGFVK